MTIHDISALCASTESPILRLFMAEIVCFVCFACLYEHIFNGFDIETGPSDDFKRGGGGGKQMALVHIFLNNKT